MSLLCTICREDKNLINCCQCKGSIAWVHFECVKQWIQRSGRLRCDLCLQPYKGIEVIVKPKSVLSFLSRRPLAYTAIAIIYLLICLIAFAICLSATKRVDYCFGIGVLIGNSVGFGRHIVAVVLKDFYLWKNSGDGNEILVLRQ